MGLSESKVILETLQRACTKAENDGKHDIVPVLSEPEFINSLRDLWVYIPLKTRRSIGRRPDKRLRSSQKRRKAPNKSMITFPQAFTAKLHLWEDDPLLFFTEDNRISLDLGSDPLARSYNYVSGLERRTEIDTMRLRLCKVVYHRLKERLCLNQLRTDNVETVAQIISQSGIAKDKLDLIKQRVSRWTDEGRRIDTLCRDINTSKSLDDSHLGTLFCLPEDIPDELIRVLPFTGEIREEEIRLLRDRGISQVDGKKRLENLAKRIFNRLWERMESAISRLHSSEPGSNWELQHTQYFRIQDARNSSPEYDEGTNAPTVTAIYQSPSPPSPQMNTASVQPVFENIEPQQALQHTQSFRMQDTRGPKEQDTGPYEYILNPTSSVTGSAVSTPIFPASSRNGSQEHSTIHPNAEANQVPHTFVLPENTQTMFSFDLQDRQAMAGMGSTFNIHDNPQLPLQGGLAMAGMETTFNIHDNPQLPLQGGQAMAGMGSTFNIHDNPQLPLQGGLAMAGMETTFNIHDNPQLPLQGGLAMAGMETTFNIHDNPQLPLQDGQASTGIGSSTNLFIGIQNPESQIPSDTSCILAPLHQHNFPDQAFTPPILVT